jgi:2,4-dienoyl-CoA reductase-like NADH-dependent reductase (Old Yellow Enzyme family)/thioredoxin reductase
MRKMLGSSCNIGNLTIKNRIVMESMGNALSERNGEVSKEDLAFYLARAKGGVGLIMSEAVSVDSETGRANPRNMCIDKDTQIPGYRQLTDALHQYGCRFFVELYHPGRQGVSELNGGRKMFAPSAIECGVMHQPVVEMTLADIRYMIQKFVDGAVRCRKAGVDGVLIHAAHGYLINEFLSPYTNRRTDQYGGSAENWARFAVEIIRGIRAACGADYPVGIRMTACEYLNYIGMERRKGITIDLSKQYAGMFENAGVDLLDVSSGIYETMNTAWEPAGFDQGWKSDLAKEIKSISHVPVVCTSLIRDPAFAERLLEDGICDFVGSARAHLADPEWANKALDGKDDEIRNCISCLNCMKSLMAGSMNCAVNAQACHETDRCALRKNGAERLVVVIGGGPAGMEAARVLAIRGFQVTLFEKESSLGGAMVEACKPPHKEKIAWFTHYLSTQLEKLHVTVKCGVSATPEMVRKLNPYAVFVAAGASHMVPRAIPGMMGSNVCTAAEILSGKKTLKGKTVVLIGAGMTGLETAEYLTSVGNHVSVFEMLPEIASGEYFQNVMDLEKRLTNVPQYPLHQLTEIAPQGCVFKKLDSGENIIVPCDAVVLSMGMQPNRDFAETFRGFQNYRVLGTNAEYSSIGPAVESGYLAAYDLG